MSHGTPNTVELTRSEIEQLLAALGHYATDDMRFTAWDLLNSKLQGGFDFEQVTRGDDEY